MSLLPAETLQPYVALCLEGGHPHQELAQNILLELLHLLRGQVRMQGSLALELLHMGLELLLQQGQRLLGLLQPVRAESSRALRGQQSDLDVPQVLDRLTDRKCVASKRLAGLRDVLLKQNEDNFLTTHSTTHRHNYDIQCSYAQSSYCNTYKNIYIKTITMLLAICESHSRMIAFFRSIRF